MLRWIIVPIALFAAACSPPAQQEPAKSDAEMNVAEPAAPVAAGPITSTGTVTQVDPAAGTITINHQAIAAISWPAMTMQFTAENPASTSELTSTACSSTSSSTTRMHGPAPPGAAAARSSRWTVGFMARGWQTDGTCRRIVR